MDKQENAGINPSENENFNFIKKLLSFTYLVVLVGVIVLTIAGIVIGSRNSAVIGGVGTFLMASMLLLIWKNHLSIPRFIGPLIAFGAGVSMTLSNNGIHDRNILNFALAIVVGGMFLGQKGIVIFGGLTLFAVSGIVYAEINGLLPSPLSAYTTIADGIIVNVFFALISTVFYASVRNLNQNMERLRRSEAALSENNRALEAARLGLEEQVIERTRNLETARQEVEAANQALQAQMWQIAGLAELGDVMRGDQDIATLARNVVRQLCQYLGVPLGALYVMESETLTLIGSYAYVYRKHLANQFSLGQGLVGQVAREQKMITLSDVPADYVTLRTGLEEIPLYCIMGVPFLYNDQLVGVVELGALREFTTSQLHFLEIAMSNIAVAFHTAQSRARIDALLTKTQEKQLSSQSAARGDHVEKN
ncbi:MAG: GAF domain-containing protein [Anaerolineae bacterium]|nr:GAF domain-containing protein [Anaerolineae bacterium]